MIVLEGFNPYVPSTFLSEFCLRSELALDATFICLNMWLRSAKFHKSKAFNKNSTFWWVNGDFKVHFAKIVRYLQRCSSISLTNSMFDLATQNLLF